MGLNVLIDARLISNKPTGIDRYIRHIISFLDTNNDNLNIFLLMNFSQQKILKNSGLFNYHIIFTRFSPFNPLHVLFLSFKLYILKDKYNMFFWTIYSGVFFKTKNIKQLTMVHDLMYKIVPNFFNKNLILNRIKQYFMDFIVKNTLIKSNLILTNSNTTKNDILRFFNLNSYVTPLGISLNYKTNIEKSKYVSILKEIQDKYFLYIGNNRQQKNLEFLINTFLASKSNKKLVIVGCEITIPSSKIINFETVTDSELILLYNNSFCFVFPSLYEGYGFPIIESAKFGKRILSSDRGSLIEFSNLRVNYFDPLDSSSLLKYFNNESLIKSIDKRYLNNYTWEKHDLILNKKITELLF